jgi:hypothetical protein
MKEPQKKRRGNPSVRLAGGYTGGRRERSRGAGGKRVPSRIGMILLRIVARNGGVLS